MTCNWRSFNFWICSQSLGTDETQQLQKALLDYLEENADTDASLVVSFGHIDSSASDFSKL